MIALDVNHPAQGAETITAATAATFYSLADLNVASDAFEFTITPTQASTAYVGGNYWALFASAGPSGPSSATGGIWLVDATLRVFQSGTDAQALNQALTWSANQTLRFRFWINAGVLSVTISQATTGNGTFALALPGPYFAAAQDLGVGSLPGSGAYRFNGAISDVDDTVSGTTASVSTSAGSPALVSATAAASTTSVNTSAGSPVLTSAAASAANEAAISTSAGSPALTSATAAASTAAVNTSAGSPALTSAAATPSSSLWGQIGASGIGQRIHLSPPATGTFSTQFFARVPGAAVAQNDRLVFNGRRWHVHTAGVLSAGSGPSGATGVQADGTAQVVPVNGGTELTMTTQPSNSVILAWVMRNQWALDTSAPTDNKGNTYGILGTSHAYNGFAQASAAMYAATNIVGGANHVVQATWPADGSSGAECTVLAVEVPTGSPTAFIADHAWSQQAAPGGGTLTSPPVTTTAPAVIVVALLGGGNVATPIGSSHTGTPQAPYLMTTNADGRVSIHANGYVQGQVAYFFAATPGVHTCTWNTTEPAQLFAAAVQEVAGSTAAVTTSAPAAVLTSAAVVSSAATVTTSAPAATLTSTTAASSSAAVTTSAPAAALSSVVAASSSAAAATSAPAATLTSAAAASSSTTVTTSAPAAVLSSAAVSAPNVVTVTTNAPAATLSSAAAASSSTAVTTSAPAAVLTSAAATPSSFWAVVARRCPAAAELLPAEQAMYEVVLDRQVPTDAPDLARVYLARHLVTLAASGARGTLGPVTRQALGPDSTTYGAPAPGSLSTAYHLTGWGALYLACVGAPGPEIV